LADELLLRFEEERALPRSVIAAGRHIKRPVS
jgi:hypothetical protein